MRTASKSAPRGGSSTTSVDTALARARDQAVLFVDVVASTQIVCRCGDIEWAELLHRHARAMQAVVRRHHGRVGAFLGDGFLFQFDEAGDAVRAALRMHHAVSVQDLFEVRMGLDHGPVVDFGDDWAVGLTLHVASRLADWCEPSEIAISDRCHAAARESVAIPQATDVRVQLRGVDRVTRAHVIRPGASW